MWKKSLEIVHYLTILDWISFSVVLILTIAAIFYGHSLKNKDPALKGGATLEILLMGRKLTLPLFIGTLVATWYGGIFGVTAIAFEKGLYNFVTQGFFWYLSYLIFAFFLVDRISTHRALTLPDMIDKMFGPRSAKLAALFNLFNVLPIAYIISLGLFIQILFGLSLTSSMFIGISLVVSYSLIGGFRAVVFSDLIQFFVMCLSVLIIIFFSYREFGGLAFLKANLPANHFTLNGGESWSSVFVWGLIALSTLVDPNFYQRCFAAKSPQTAKKGIIIATVIWLIFDLCTTFGAMYAKAVIPEALPNEAYLSYAIQLLPPGVRGFVLAGILATILSTLDSYLFLAASTLSFDLWPSKREKKVHYYKQSIILIAIVSWSMALLFEGNIKAVWKTLGSYSTSCLLLPVLYGHFFPKRLSDNQFFYSCISGVIAVSLWKFIPHTFNLDELYIGILTTGLVMVFFSSSFHLKSNK